MRPTQVKQRRILARRVIPARQDSRMLWCVDPLPLLWWPSDPGLKTEKWEISPLFGLMWELPSVKISPIWVFSYWFPSIVGQYVFAFICDELGLHCNASALGLLWSVMSWKQNCEIGLGLHYLYYQNVFNLWILTVSMNGWPCCVYVLAYWL